VTRGTLSYVDRGLPFTLDVAVETFVPKVGATVSSVTAAPVNTAYTTRYAFGGSYRDATLSGDALTGDVLSFQESGVSFPLDDEPLLLETLSQLLEMQGATVVSVDGASRALEIARGAPFDVVVVRHRDARPRRLLAGEPIALGEGDPIDPTCCGVRHGAGGRSSESLESRVRRARWQAAQIGGVAG